jgi:hypothetical protein
LRGGFAGTLALVAPRLALGACQTGRATAYGRVTIADEQPRFEGPVRVAELACPGSDLRVGGADFQLDALGDRDLAGVTLKGHLRTSALAAAGAGAQSLGLDTALAWRSGVLSGRVSATAGGLRSGQGGIGLLGLDGLVKVRQIPGGGADSEFRGTVDARGLRRGLPSTRRWLRRKRPLAGHWRPRWSPRSAAASARRSVAAGLPPT